MKLIYKKSIITLVLAFIFLSTIHAQKKTEVKDVSTGSTTVFTNYESYTIHSLRIANIIKQKAEYMAENELNGISFSKEQKELLKKVNIGFPKKISVFTYNDFTFDKNGAYPLEGPIGTDPEVQNFAQDIIETRKIENKAIRDEILRHHKNYILSMPLNLFWLNNNTDVNPVLITSFLNVSDFFTDENISESPGLCILEYENSYPVMVSFTKGRDNAVYLSGSVCWIENPSEDDISFLLMTNCNMILQNKYVTDIQFDAEEFEKYKKAYDIIGTDYEPVILKTTNAVKDASKIPVLYEFGTKINPFTGEEYLCNYISYPYYSIKKFGSGFDGKIIKINKDRKSNKYLDTSITIQKGDVQVTYSGWINIPDNLKEGDSITKDTLLGTLFGGGDSGMKLKIQVKYKDQYLNPAYLRYLKVIK